MELSLKAWVPSVAVDMQALNADGYDMADGKSVEGAAKADGLDGRNATEGTAITFTALANNETVTVGDLTLTAKADGMTAAEVASVFASISADIGPTQITAKNGVAPLTATKGELSGTFDADAFVSGGIAID
jgi:hypothetical protein